MKTLIEESVLRQALEALESLWVDKEILSMEDHDKAITALRTALDAAEKVEPDYDWDQLEACRDSLREHMRVIAEMNRVGAWKLIRDTFEARMKSNGYGTTALTRLDSGDYMSPSVHRHWEDELKNYAAPKPEGQL